MREEQDATASFDLFLDTICNTFGGIVFLAILLAVMVQNRSLIETKNSEERTHASPAQVREAIAQLADLSTKQKLTQLTLAAMPEKAGTVDDTELLDLREHRERLKQEIGDALAVEAESSKQLAQQLESNAVQREQNQAVPEQLQDAKELLSATRADFERTLEAKQETLRVPRVRASSQASMLILVQDSNVYLAMTPSGFGRGFNDAQVSTTETFGNETQISPIRGTGWDLDNGVGSTQFQLLVDQAKSSNHSITIAVWPESFDDFSRLRKTMIEAEVYYQLWPQSTGESLEVSFGSGSSSVQ